MKLEITVPSDISLSDLNDMVQEIYSRYRENVIEISMDLSSEITNLMRDWEKHIKGGHNV